MYERFSESARQVIVFATQEARARKAAYVGTEHLLAGVLGAEQRFGSIVLDLGLSLERVRARLPDGVAPGEQPPPAQRIGFSARAKTALEHALRESQAVDRLRIEPGDILLGLLRVDEGTAMEILLALEVPLERLRHAVLGFAAAPEASVARRPRSRGEERFLEDVAKARRLTAQEEVDLARRIESGDASAKHVIVESNLHLVVSVAEEFRDSGRPFLQLVQQGTLGLVRAAEQYDHRTGSRFSEHATAWVRQAIARFVAGPRG